MRMNGETMDKILAPLANACAFTHSLRAFRESEVASQYVVAYRDDNQRATLETLIRQEMPYPVKVTWAHGGPTRRDSVWNALQKLDAKTTYVFIHDCARPLILPSQLVDLLELVRADGTACVARRITDTIKQSPANHRDLRQMKLQNVPRERLWAMETPQVFDRNLIVDAYRRVIETNMEVTDDAAAVESFGHTLSLFENNVPNLKLTTPPDFDLIQALLERRI